MLIIKISKSHQCNVRANHMHSQLLTIFPIMSCSCQQKAIESNLIRIKYQIKFIFVFPKKPYTDISQILIAVLSLNLLG